jgi:hypothetical protein
VRVSGGASRAVELDPGFLADLYAEPVTETPTEADGQTDT